MMKKVVFLILFLVILSPLPQSIRGETGWVSKAPMPTPRGNIASAVAGTKIYVFGGSPGTPSFYYTNEAYDTSSNSWSKLSDLPTSRGYAVAQAVNGKIYVIGGLNSPNGWDSLAVNEEYDPLTDSWTSKAPLPIWGRHAATSATVNGKIYVIGGYCPPYNAEIMLNWNEAYDPATDTWQSSLLNQLASMPTARRNLAAAVVDGKIYAIGGTSISSELGTNEMYDPSTNVWTTKASMPTPREALTLAVVGDKIYAIGGRISEAPFDPSCNIVEEYDTKLDTWKTVDSMITARAYLTSGTVSGTIYVIGGYDLWNVWTPLTANEALTLDSTPPSIWITQPTDYGIYSASSGAKFNFGATDNIDPSPIVAASLTLFNNQAVPVASDDNLPTQSGVYTLTVTATDASGNSAQMSITFVVYDPSAGSMTTHNPISIEGNDQFTIENGVVSGHGTQEDPYIIENYEISALEGTAISIQSTSKYFEIKGCYIYGSNYGILLSGVGNGVIINNVFQNNHVGVYIGSGLANQIVGDTFTVPAAYDAYAAIMDIGGMYDKAYMCNFINSNVTGWTIDARYCWWGDISGPRLSPHQSGSGSVVEFCSLFSPWLTAPVEDASQGIGINQALEFPQVGINVDLTGLLPTQIYVTKYASEPAAGLRDPVGTYIDVFVPDTSKLSSITVKVDYDPLTLPPGTIESQLTLNWYNGQSWAPCSVSGVNTVEHYVWAQIDTTTTPSLSNLSGTLFGISKFVDKTPPTISINSPSDYSIYAANSGLKYSFSAADNIDPNPIVLAKVALFDGTTISVSSGQSLPSQAGVYTLQVTATDASGNSARKSLTFVVYDPTVGFVTGGGWINSPVGAYQPDLTLTGKATFAFECKYKKGATVPDGNTEFKFQTGNLNFKSTSLEWMVIAGAKAQYKGEGTINGAGTYKFILTAIDGDLLGKGKPDMFRMKIWDKATGKLVYDNKLGASDTADPTTAIAGGSIVIHK